jgi:hypothetical protein
MELADNLCGLDRDPPDGLGESDEDVEDAWGKDDMVDDVGVGKIVD